MRLFIAVNLPESIKAGIDQALQPLRQSADSMGTRVKWVASDHYHMTIKFLGNGTDDQLPKINDALQQTSANTRPFALSLAGLGCFPARGKPNILWFGITEGVDTLTKLAADLEAALEPIGFQKELRPFSAHVTVGRIQFAPNALKLRQAIEAVPKNTLGPFTAESLDLMKSVLSAAGPEYTLLKASSFPAVTGGESMDPRQRHSRMTT